MENTGTLLVVDDEEEICNFLKDYLEQHGYEVFTANDGDAMRAVMNDNSIDLVILDLLMPGEDGLTLTRYLREKSKVAIIILTGKDEEVDRIVGLEMGADDYIAKPFSSRELLARVKTVLRRVNERTEQITAGANGGSVQFAGWSFDKVGRRLMSPAGSEVALTTMEFNLLTAFTDNPNRVLDRDRLLDLLQNRSWEPYDRSIDVLLGRLRSKIENNPKRPELIKTVRGTGYVLATTVDSGQ
ncbi:MAG: response regulator [Rhodospirillaceae bacterium]|nr:response regulator [Rhodospirillaceae bacterium]